MSFPKNIHTFILLLIFTIALMGCKGPDKEAGSQNESEHSPQTEINIPINSNPDALYGFYRLDAHNSVNEPDNQSESTLNNWFDQKLDEIEHDTVRYSIFLDKDKYKRRGPYTAQWNPENDIYLFIKAKPDESAPNFSVNQKEYKVSDFEFKQIKRKQNLWFLVRLTNVVWMEELRQITKKDVPVLFTDSLIRLDQEGEFDGPLTTGEIIIFTIEGQDSTQYVFHANFGNC